MDSDADTPPGHCDFSAAPVNVSARPRHHNTNGTTLCSWPSAKALRYLLYFCLRPMLLLPSWDTDCLLDWLNITRLQLARACTACSMPADPGSRMYCCSFPALHSTARLGNVQTVRRRALGGDAAKEAAEPAYNKGVTGIDERPKLIMLRALLLRLWDSFELPPNPLDGDPPSLPRTAYACSGCDSVTCGFMQRPKLVLLCALLWESSELISLWRVTQPVSLEAHME